MGRSRRHRRRAELALCGARAVARRLAEPRHRALSVPLLESLRIERGPELRGLGDAQAQGERREELDQGRRVARGNVPLPARARFRRRHLRSGLSLGRPVECHAQAPVLGEGRRELENSLRRSRMNLRHLFMLSAAAVVPNALAADPQVDIRTSAGTIRLELYPSKAPKTVENFLQYVRDGHYNGTIFHRVIPGFMIQGGGMTPNMAQKATRPPVPRSEERRVGKE